MTFKVSTRVRIKGRNIVVQQTADSDDHLATLEAIRAVGEDARRLHKASDIAIKSKRQAFRRKKADRDP